MKKQRMGARLAAFVLASLAILYGGMLSAAAAPLDILTENTVYLGGTPFGVKLHTKGAVVIGTDDITSFGGTVSPGKEAGVKKGDIITAVDGKALENADELRLAVENCRGNAVVLTVNRGGESLQITLYPALSAEDNKYRAGLWLRDSAAGIGTVTYTCADGAFVGLGHGIMDADSGSLLPIGDGAVVDVEITGVKKGVRGAPGELRGSFGSVKRGEINDNRESGVYGKLFKVQGAAISMAKPSEVKTGKAYIYTTVDGSTPERYEIEIEKLYSGNTKNMLLRVTDKRLIEKTGGIVQGMSGSPIVQNGKLIGAVTHVLVNDPERGYGIFIDNMLK